MGKEEPPRCFRPVSGAVIYTWRQGHGTPGGSRIMHGNTGDHTPALPREMKVVVPCVLFSVIHKVPGVNESGETWTMSPRYGEIL